MVIVSRHGITVRIPPSAWTMLLGHKNVVSMPPFLPTRSCVWWTYSEDVPFTSCLQSSITIPGEVTGCTNRPVNCVHCDGVDFKVFHAALEYFVRVFPRPGLGPIEIIMNDCRVCISSVRPKE